MSVSLQLQGTFARQAGKEGHKPNQPHQTLSSGVLPRFEFVDHQLLERLALGWGSQLPRADLLNVAIDIVLDWVERDGAENIEELGELLSSCQKCGGVDSVVLVGVHRHVDEGGLHLIEERHLDGLLPLKCERSDSLRLVYVCERERKGDGGGDDGASKLWETWLRCYGGVVAACVPEI